MYNRYIRNDRGTYTRITEDDGRTSRRPQPSPQPSGPPHTPPKPFNPPPPPGNQIQDALSRFIRHFLRLSHMDNVDTGDMLVLLLLFLLYREGADEETLVALGLLLIL